MNQMNKTNL